MKFRTEIEKIDWKSPIEYSNHIVTLGSCFAERISSILEERKFSVTPLPTGILFNPASIAQSIKLMTSNHRVTSEELLEVDGRWLSYNFHSSLSASTPEEAIEVMQRAIERGGEALQRATHLIITLGTAWVYRLRESGKVVANCHKQPASLFCRELLDVGSIVDMLRPVCENFNGEIILTLSPVRHVGEGLVDNSLSKATLRVAIENLKRAYPERVTYFPAYEILIDDLRDYRFYGEDLVHPSTMAVEYIAERFFEAALSPNSKEVMERVERIVQASHHRPRNPHSESYKRFCHQQLSAIAEIKGVDLSKEKHFFDSMLQINL
jgi:hypothetical protein